MRENEMTNFVIIGMLVPAGLDTGVPRSQVVRPEQVLSLKLWLRSKGFGFIHVAFFKKILAQWGPQVLFIDRLAF